eukprot:2222399-Pyramimonas_sp.AAC.1
MCPKLLQPTQWHLGAHLLAQGISWRSILNNREPSPQQLHQRDNLVQKDASGRVSCYARFSGVALHSSAPSGRRVIFENWWPDRPAAEPNHLCPLAPQKGLGSVNVNSECECSAEFGSIDSPSLNDVPKCTDGRPARTASEMAYIVNTTTGRVEYRM